MDTHLNAARLVINLSQPVFQVIEKCPMTGKLAERGEENSFSIPDGQAIWWNCSACQGWHASVLPEEDNALL